MEVIEVEKKSYELVYESAFFKVHFPCDKEGNILWAKVACPYAVRKELAHCKAHPEQWTSGKVVARISHDRYGVCPYCGHKVYFDGPGYMGAVECDCGQWYNWFGQELYPPDEWEEDDF